MEYTYNGQAEQIHPEFGRLVPGKTYDVSKEQARWLSPEAGWSPKGKKPGADEGRASEGSERP